VEPTVACAPLHESPLAERFNNTLRQRVSRLVRETLSFSKKLANHVGCHQIVYLPLQPDESSSITWIALPIAAPRRLCWLGLPFAATTRHRDGWHDWRPVR
jgi:hypothetical protein